MKLRNIKQLEPGKFEIRFSYKDHLTGKLKRVRRRISGTLADAVKLRDELKAAAHEGALDEDVKAADRCLREWMDDYLNHRKHRDKIASSSLNREEYVLQANILPDAGEWRPEAVQLQDVERLVDRWLSTPKSDGTPYSRVTIRDRASLFTRFLRWVLKRAGLDTGWVRDVDRVKVKAVAKKGRALMPAEAKAFLAELKATYPQHFGLCFLLLATGQRFGSVTSLHWTDLDRDAGWVTFSRSQYRGAVKHGNKNGKVVRLPLTPDLLEVFDWHRQHMTDTKHPGLATDLVFPSMTAPADSATNGHRVASDLRRPFRGVCKTIKIDRITPHDLRRTFNSWAAEKVSGTVLRSITGHSSIRMTDNYYHGSKQAKLATLQGVVDLVK